ncbi:uncharacterized protein LOC144115754 isoform X2 [Amblyomma americanum]
MTHNHAPKFTSPSWRHFYARTLLRPPHLRKQARLEVQFLAVQEALQKDAAGPPAAAAVQLWPQVPCHTTSAPSMLVVAGLPSLLPPAFSTPLPQALSISVGARSSVAISHASALVGAVSSAERRALKHGVRSPCCSGGGSSDEDLLLDVESERDRFSGPSGSPNASQERSRLCALHRSKLDPVRPQVMPPLCEECVFLDAAL